MTHYQAETRVPVKGDVVVPFTIEGRGVSGRVTRLDAVVDEILNRHAYPDAVSLLLGQALAITALLGSLMKKEGVFTFQAKGDGLVSLLVADFVSASGADGAISIGGILRGYARYDEAALAAHPVAEADLKALMGSGYLAFTLDQGEDTDRYQGIVELDGNSLDACAQTYFMRSEQIEARIVSHCAAVDDPTKGRTWRSASLMLRHLPGHGGTASGHGSAEERAENWNHVRVMTDSLRSHELLDTHLPLHDLLYRLYHEDGVRVYAPSHLALGCRCNRDRLANVIRTFTAEERAEMTENGVISAICEFCKTDYRFDPQEFA